MINIKTLYKKDSSGKIRFKSISTLDEKLITITGLHETKNPVYNEVICSPKNINKKNYVSAIEQAKKEAKALIEKSLKDGYFEDYFEANSSELFRPMLAKVFEENVDFDKEVKHKNGCFIQPKLDGMRCIYRNGKLYSREGREIKYMDHIIKALDQVFNKHKLKLKDDDFYLDGELYIHGLKFQEIMDHIKDYDYQKNKKVCYHIYDIYLPQIPHTFKERIANVAKVTNLFSNIKYPGKIKDTIKNVDTYFCNSLDALRRQEEYFLGLGYEGAMLRKNDLYEPNKRSSSLLKIKKFKDIACEIIEIGPAKRKTEWARPVVLFNGKHAPCNLSMTVEQKKEMLLNKEKYIGKIAEVRYFELTDDGMPRFPVIVGIREDKLKPDNIVIHKTKRKN